MQTRQPVNQNPASTRLAEFQSTEMTGPEGPLRASEAPREDSLPFGMIGTQRGSHPIPICGTRGTHIWSHFLVICRIHSPDSRAAALRRARKGKQSNRPSVRERADRIWYIHTRKGRSLGRREGLTDATVRMETENIMKDPSQQKDDLLCDPISIKRPGRADPYWTESGPVAARGWEEREMGVMDKRDFFSVVTRSSSL